MFRLIFAFRLFSLLCVGFFSFLLSGSALAGVSAEVLKGGAWLGSQVKVGGTLAGEAASLALPLPARAESLLTLKQLGQPSAPLADALESLVEEGTESLSRKIVALSAVGKDINALRNALVDRQNADGGFAPQPGFASHPYDTAWAAIALARIGQGPGGAAAKARAFLRTQVDGDGAAVDRGTIRQRLVQTSLMVVAWRADAVVHAADIQSAVDYIKSQQSADGSWLSDVYVTATAWLAISDFVFESAERSRLFSTLVSRQAADGSWGQDPFVTALALRALLADRVDPTPSVTAAVSGLVVDQSTRAALSGVSVVLKGGSNASATSGPDGRFRVSGLASGAYTIEFGKSGYQASVLDVVLGAGQQLDVGTLALSQVSNSGLVRGQTLDAATGAALPGVVISIAGTPARIVVSDAAGRYEIGGLPAGPIQLSAARDGYTAVSGTGALVAGGILVFSPSLYKTGVSSPTTGTLKGKVVDAANGQALAGVSLQLNGSERVRSAADGTFSLTLSPAQYDARYVLAGYQSAGQNFYLSAGSIVDAGVVQLSRQVTVSRLSGRVLKVDGSALAGARVQIQGGATATSGADGTYALEGLSGTNFTVFASATGFQTQGITLTVPAPQEVLQNFTLVAERQGSLTLGLLAVAPVSVASNADVMIEVPVTNSTSDAVEGSLVLQVRDAADKVVGNGVALNEAGQPLGQIVFSSGETRTVKALWNSAQYPAGAYSLVMRAVAKGTNSQGMPDGQVLGESRGRVTVLAERKLAGGLLADPPVLRAGANSPVKLTGKLKNIGNVALPTQPYRVSAINVQTGDQVYSQSVQGAELAVGAMVSLVFPDWTPVAAGNYRLELVSSMASDGKIITAVYVGDSATANYTVTPTTVPIGDQTVKGSVRVTGQDAVSGVISDPLAPLIKTAIKKAVAFNDFAAADWTLRNQCQGCHVQTQGLVSGEKNRHLAPDFDRYQRSTIFNNTSTNQTRSGSLDETWGSGPTTVTMLGLWALTSAEHRSEFALTLKRASDFLVPRQSVDGYWSADYGGGWWAPVAVTTSSILRGLLETHKVLKADDPASVLNYKSTPFTTSPGMTAYGALAVDAADNFYAATTSHEIWQIKPDGTKGRVWSGFGEVRGLIKAQDAAGGVLAATASGLYRLNADGSNSKLGSDGRPWSLAYSPDGVLYATGLDNAVYRFGPTWQLEVFVSGGLLSRTTGLAFDSDGSLLVGSYYSRAIVRVQSDKTMRNVVGQINYYPQQILAYQGNWLVTTERGLYRYNKDWEGERLLFDRVDNLAVRQDGRIAMSVNSQTNLRWLDSEPAGVAASLSSYEAAINKATQWLSTTSPGQVGNSDNIELAHRIAGMDAARKFYADSDPGRYDTISLAMTTLAVELRRRQNANGGWGRYWYAPGHGGNYGSDSMVTAQVGAALDTLNPSARSPEVRKAVEWLLSIQGADGAWSSQNGILSTKEAATTWVAIWLPTVLDRLGGIDADLTLTYPKNVSMSNARPLPLTVEVLPSEEVSYKWTLQGVTNAGQELTFDLKLKNLQVNEKRPVSTEAYLTFKNSFTGENQNAPIAVPVVKASAFIDLDATTDKPAYGADSDFKGKVQLTNANAAAINGVLTVSIEDNAGTLVASLSRQNVGIPAKGSLTVDAPWNTGTTLVGRYKLKAVLLDAAAPAKELAQDVAEFDIITGQASLTGSVSTDKAVYQARDLVTVRGRAYNRASNVLLENLVLQERVVDAGGTEIYSASRAIAQISPGAYREQLFAFRLGADASGDHVVTQTILDSGGVVQDTQSVHFRVQSGGDTGSGLRGTIKAETPLIQRGKPVMLRFKVSNLGNAALGALPVSVRIVDPESGMVQKEFSATVSLAQLADYLNSLDWNSSETRQSGASPGYLTNGVPKTYIAALSATVGGKEIALAQDSFSVATLVPFNFTPQQNVPLSSLRTSNSITLAGLAGSSPISIAGGQYSLNGGAYTSAAGSVSSGDMVSLRQTSASAPLSKTSATLTVAGYSAAFDVTTLKADEAVAIPTLSEWALLAVALLTMLFGGGSLGWRRRKGLD